MNETIRRNRALRTTACGYSYGVRVDIHTVWKHNTCVFQRRRTNMCIGHPNPNPTLTIMTNQNASQVTYVQHVLSNIDDGTPEPSSVAFVRKAN
jgi:hypothetical protein